MPFELYGVLTFLICMLVGQRIEKLSELAFLCC